MHELSIAESVVDAVLARTGDRPVTTVRLLVGRLSGVVPESLMFCFELATAGTTLEGATLAIETPGGRAHCRDCDTDFVLNDLILLCHCGSADVEIVAGHELQVMSVEVG
jgi:hydrogenase nickel incorporation protein HypA/HybF